jgi:hypothetical protein
MKNLHTLKLNASSLGSAAPRTTSVPQPAEEAPAAPTQEIRVEEPVAQRTPPTGLRKRLLMLGVVELAATLAAVAATGSVHNTLFRIAAAGLALTVALVVAIETLAPRRRMRTAAASARPVAIQAPRKALSKSKIGLLLMMAIGFATYFGNGGTFSSFSAETTNATSNISSGTLTMSNVVNNSVTTCYSYNGAANVNGACDALFALTGGGTPTQANNLAPSFYGGVSKVVLQNTGSIDATKLQLYAPSTTDCVDAKVSAYTWNSGSLCGSAILYLQETGTSHHYCWFGVGAGTSRCAAPLSEAYAGAGTVATPISWTNGSVGVNGNIASGDTIQVSQLNAATQTYNVEQCTASANVWAGDATTSVAVSGCSAVSGSNGSFTSAATVTDLTTTNTTLVGTFAADSINNFDTSHGSVGAALTLYPTTADGTINNSGFGLGLASGGSRTFFVGAYLPTPASTNQNTLQGLKSTFSLTWHTEQ